MDIATSSASSMTGLAAGEPPFPPARKAWAIVAVLAAINITALLDRFLPAVLMEPIKLDMHLTDTSVSVIQGYAFAIFYCLAGLPLARVIDRGNRRNLMIAAVLAWSVMTICCGLSPNYITLFVSRAGVAIAEAVLAPCCYSIIADCFPRHLRGRAIGLVYASQAVGSSGSFMLGGALFEWLTHHGGLSLFGMAPIAPWRATFMLASIPGLIAIVGALTFKEPLRREIDGDARTAKLLPFLRANSRCLVPLYATFGLICFVTMIGPTWATAFYVRIYHLHLLQGGLIIGVTLAVAGIAGPILSGLLGDYWAARTPGSRFRLPLLSLIFGIPCFAIWPLLPLGGLSYLALGLAITITSMGLSSAPAILQEISPNSIRARALAVNQTVQFITSGFSPTAVALLTDHAFHDPMALPSAIIICSVVGGVLALVTCIATLKPYAQTYAEVTAR